MGVVVIFRRSAAYKCLVAFGIFANVLAFKHEENDETSFFRD